MHKQLRVRRAGPILPEMLPRVELKVTRKWPARGAIRCGAPDAFQIRMQMGPPARYTCGSNRSILAHGELTALPAGVIDDCILETHLSTAIEVELSQDALRQASLDMGLDPERVAIAPRYGIRDRRIEHILGALDLDDPTVSDASLYREGLALALAAHVLYAYAERPPRTPRGTLSLRQRQRLVDYVEAHLAEDLSAARLAREVGISASHFRLLFKRTMGVTLHEYVVKRRVERARQLLLQGELSITQVALDAGFSHQSHMAAWMRRLLGVRPRDIGR